MTKRAIYITEYDLLRLQPLLEAARRYERADHEALSLLQQELDRAILCDADELPSDIVSMNSTAKVTDLDTGKLMEFTIVFPRGSDYNAGRISVLAPIGTALLGYSKGEEVEWPTPGGLRTFRIESVKRSARKLAVAKIA
jgi:regulator of nucleoside diphosphate kinase